MIFDPDLHYIPDSTGIQVLEDPHSAVSIVATASAAPKLQPSLLKSGVFEHVIDLPPLDRVDRAAVLETLVLQLSKDAKDATKQVHSDDLDFVRLANRTEG